MRNFAAIIPASAMGSTNGGLNEGGWGADNFSVPAFNGPNPTHVLLHSWRDEALFNAVAAIPGAVIVIDQEPWTLVTDVTIQTGTTWAQDAKPLEGIATPGLYFTMGDDRKYWWVIQQYDTAIWPDPVAVPALVAPARMPGEITTWVQPLNQFTAYFLVNQFTGQPDEVAHNGKIWVVSQGDGAGLNIWEPGVFGWMEKV